MLFIEAACGAQSDNFHKRFSSKPPVWLWPLSCNRQKWAWRPGPGFKFPTLWVGDGILAPVISNPQNVCNASGLLLLCSANPSEFREVQFEREDFVAHILRVWNHGRKNSVSHPEGIDRRWFAGRWGKGRGESTQQEFGQFVQEKVQSVISYPVQDWTKNYRIQDNKKRVTLHKVALIDAFQRSHTTSAKMMWLKGEGRRRRPCWKHINLNFYALYKEYMEYPPGFVYLTKNGIF